MSAADTPPKEKVELSESSESPQSQQEKAAEEYVTQAVLGITTKIQENTVAEERKSFLSIIKSWFAAQFNKLGQAILALAAALIIALVTPLVVKLELNEKLQDLSQSLVTMANDSHAQDILANTLILSETTDQIHSQNSDLVEAISTLETKLSTIQPPEIILSSLDNMENKIFSQEVSQQEHFADIQAQLKKLETSVARIQTPKQHHGFNTSQLASKIAVYISQGKALDLSNKEKINNWIGEVYFFVSIIPTQHIDLIEVKANLQDIYNAERQFDKDSLRVSRTLLILEALRSWMDVLKR